MPENLIRVLVVDDFEPWRRFVCSTLQTRPELEVIGEASDGLEALRKAEELQPHLVLLDVGLPALNGIEAAKRIRLAAPNSKILIVSQDRSREIAEKALEVGVSGYVLKSAALSDLLLAIDAAVEGRQFVSTGLKGLVLGDAAKGHRDSRSRFNHSASMTVPQPDQITHKHEACFYWNDGDLLDDATQFIGAVLKAGGAAVVISTEPHRKSLLLSLQAYGVDAVAATAQGRYFEFDAANTIASTIVDGVFDSTRFAEAFSEIIATARAGKNNHSRLAIFGEGAQFLLERGDANAAIRDEGLCNQLVQMYNVDFLCGYSRGIEGVQDNHIFQQICAEHSTIKLR